MTKYEFEAGNTVIQYYDANAQSYFESTKDADLSDMYSHFTPLIPESGSILDAGCGSGRDTKYFSSEGFKVVAFDASLKLAQLASDFIEIPVLHLSFEDIPFESQFDGIWANASLVHLSKPDLIKALGKLIAACRHRGVIFMSFKTGRYTDTRPFPLRTPEEIESVVKQQPFIQILKSWLGDDALSRSNTKWFNMIARVDKS